LKQNNKTTYLCAVDMHWIDSVQQYRNCFHVMVGKFAFLQQLAKQMNRSLFKGKGGIMALYRGAESLA